MGEIPPDIPPDWPPPPPDPPPWPPEPPPWPPDLPPLPPNLPPVECPDIPRYVDIFYAQYGNLCESPGCMDLCTSSFGEYYFNYYPDCPWCMYPCYQLYACTCMFPNELGQSYGYCSYVFLGCSPDGVTIPPDNTADFLENYVLQHIYNFAPIDAGKFEPDRRIGESLRSMILANYHDKTNIIIQYDPTALEY